MLNDIKIPAKNMKTALAPFFFYKTAKCWQFLHESQWEPDFMIFWRLNPFLMIFRSVLVVDFIVLMIDFICLEKENDLKVRRVPYCDTNTCVSLKSRTVPYFCWYCEESLFKQLSLICVLATFFLQISGKWCSSAFLRRT